MSEGLAEAEWATSWVLTVKNSQYELRGRRAINRAIRITTIVVESPGPDMITMTDAKSLYDCLNQEQFASAEKRAALEIAVFRNLLDNLG